MDTFTDDVLDMIDKGFPAVSMEPVVGNEDEPYAIREEDLPAVKKEYERLANTFIQREAEGKPFFFYQYESLEGPVPSKASSRMRRRS